MMRDLSRGLHREGPAWGRRLHPQLPAAKGARRSDTLVIQPQTESSPAPISLSPSLSLSHARTYLSALYGSKNPVFLYPI